MSILKGILHHYNKTNSAYDTIHPETEAAQVTDWNSGIVNTLASTALSSLVATLSSDCLLSKLIGKVLDATGVKYLMGTNGYICFGSLFGGLIIQWGRGHTGAVTPPIAYTTALQAVATWDDDSVSSHPVATVGASLYTSQFKIVGYDSTNKINIGVRWILICI